MKKVRNSNLELLRVLSMVIIILSHYVYHGGLLYEAVSANNILAQLLKIGGKLGVSCFVLISGYFLADSKFKIQNIIRICAEVIFYALIILGIKAFLIPGESVELTELVKSAFAPFYGLYWFPTAYIGLYLCFPVLNIIIDNVGRNLKKIVLVMTVALCIINFILPGANFLFSNVVWFVYLYFVAGYIKRYSCDFIEKYSMLLFLLGIAAIWGSSVILNVAGAYMNIDILSSKAYYLSNINSPFMVICALGLFVWFKNLSIKNSRIINYLGSITFAVYLLHDNSIFRDIIWKSIYRADRFYNSPMPVLLLHMLFVVISLFAAAAVIEIIRTFFEKKILECSLVKTWLDKINQWYVFTDTQS